VRAHTIGGFNPIQQEKDQDDKNSRGNMG